MRGWTGGAIGLLRTHRTQLSFVAGITGGMPEDPVMQAELLRLKLQRALGRKDQRAVLLIERELAELMEREDLGEPLSAHPPL